MKTKTMFVGLALAAGAALSLASVTVGNEPQCDRCAPGFFCDDSGARARCVLDEQSLWTLSVVDGWVAETDPGGAPWDEDGEADPYVYICNKGDVGGSTLAVQDTLTPSWNQLISANALSLEALRAGFLVELRDDDDPQGYQRICLFEQAVVDEGDLQAGAFNLSCESGGLNIRLELAGDNVSPPESSEVGPCVVP